MIKQIATVLAVTAATLVGGVAASGVAAALPNASHAPRSFADQVPMYETNAAGQTFGKFPDTWDSVEQLPDLISAYASNGKLGYVPRGAIFSPPANSLADAIAQKSAASTLVYAADGTTVIGELVYTSASGD